MIVENKTIYNSTETISKNEIRRIQSVYYHRDSIGKKKLHSWYLPYARYQETIKSRMLTCALNKTVGNDLSKMQMLDVGCGTGGFLRLLIEWGAVPTNLTGTEYLEDRLKRAAAISHPGMKWRLGELDSKLCARFDFVSAHTVFSSILSDELRQNLAESMWQVLKPGGWLMIFDFRYNNPSNRDVRKVTIKELMSWWPNHNIYYQTDMLAPPLARRLIKRSYATAEILTAFFPFLRSHFVYMTRK